MTFSSDDFRGAMSAGLAAPNKWRITLPNLSGTKKPEGGSYDGPEPRELNFHVTATRLPGADIQTVDRNIGTEPKKVAIAKTPQPVAITCYLDQKYLARKYFQGWMDCVTSRAEPYYAGFLKNYGKAVTIQQLDKEGSEIYTAILLEAYPISISDVEFNNQQATGAAEFTVTLSYTSVFTL